MIDYKTQTRRSTQFKTNVLNINLFTKTKDKKGFEFGIITSKYWGDYEAREEPLIEIEMDGVLYSMPLSEFIKKITPALFVKDGRTRERIY